MHTVALTVLLETNFDSLLFSPLFLQETVPVSRQEEKREKEQKRGM